MSTDDVSQLITGLVGFGLDVATQINEQIADKNLGKVKVAEKLCGLQIGAVSKLSDSVVFKLLDEADQYLRSIRSEEVDGSEPALGMLLDKVTDFWCAQQEQSAILHSTSPAEMDSVVAPSADTATSDSINELNAIDAAIRMLEVGKSGSGEIDSEKFGIALQKLTRARDRMHRYDEIMSDEAESRSPDGSDYNELWDMIFS